ncbi:MAG TPA: DUF6569 family protein, partial [Oceanipulchritudo sp.]|nr:DUF6569 family protein [Oceanipulchritudo sp.]
QKVHAQLIRSYAMEALVSKERSLSDAPAKADQPMDEEASQADLLAAKAFLERCACIKGKPYPSVAQGTDWRFIKEPLVGSGLEVEDTWIHMAYFHDEPDAGQEGNGARRRMARMSRRSNYRRQPREGGDDVVY